MKIGVINMELSRLTKQELINQLYSEVIFYNENLQSLCKLLCDELPKKMIYRIISKMYRVRTTKH